MIEVLVVLVAMLLTIAVATLAGSRFAILTSLLLIAAGVGASFLPAFASVTIEPEWILEGVLPPLLYSAAVSMPAMNFRREFRAISGLSVALVIASSLVLGVFFMLVVPYLGFAWGVALGAIISPTDAVATGAIKRTSVSKRVIAILDGESLLNDATALVLLRTAIVAAAAGFSFWGALGTFAYSVVVATAVGGVVGWLTLVVRKRISDPSVSTVISFVAPFAASIPVSLLGASGLVAAVVAGLVTGIRAPRELSPRARVSDGQNWRMVELVLGGLVFLTLGLQLRAIVTEVERDHAGVADAVLVAAGALALGVLVRAAYVAPLLALLQHRARRRGRRKDRLEDLQQKMSTDEGKQDALEKFNAGGNRNASTRDLERFSVRVTRGLADIEYFEREPLGWREGSVVVWAGMRGAVTVAAAQTLPLDTPQRSTLVLIAFAVAALSLIVQGGTIGLLVRTIVPRGAGAADDTRDADQRERIFHLLKTTADAVPEPPEIDPDRPLETVDVSTKYRLAVLAAQRKALLDARDNGTFDADILSDALANLDAAEITIEMRARLAG